jgi:Tfp pilus assembly PilM family ATPase
MISSQSNALDELMQQFLDQIDRDIATFVLKGEILDLNGMVHAGGAGLDTAKQCLSAICTVK